MTKDLYRVEDLTDSFTDNPGLIINGKLHRFRLYGKTVEMEIVPIMEINLQKTPSAN